MRDVARENTLSSCDRGRHMMSASTTTTTTPVIVAANTFDPSPFSTMRLSGLLIFVTSISVYIFLRWQAWQQHLQQVARNEETVETETRRQVSVADTTTIPTTTTRLISRQRRVIKDHDHDPLPQRQESDDAVVLAVMDEPSQDGDKDDKDESLSTSTILDVDDAKGSAQRPPCLSSSSFSWSSETSSGGGDGGGGGRRRVGEDASKDTITRPPSLSSYLAAGPSLSCEISCGDGDKTRKDTRSSSARNHSRDHNDNESGSKKKKKDDADCWCKDHAVVDVVVDVNDDGSNDDDDETLSSTTDTMSDTTINV
jgi:hypothetical protein